MVLSIPPLIATKDQMRMRNAADARRCAAVAVVGGNRKGQRCHDPPEAAGRRELIVVMQAVGVVHRLDPAPDVVVGQRLSQPRRLNGFAEVTIDVGTVECRRFAGHGRTPFESFIKCSDRR